MTKPFGFKIFAVTTLLLSMGLFSANAYANNSWEGYHWARTSNPLTLKLGDNVSSAWDTYLGNASSDWALSSVLDTLVVPGAGARKSKCPWTNGSVEVCNYTYGSNGWLGVAQIYISGSHITKGQVKLNDSYFNKTAYNTPAWRRMVMCQEIGHTFGLAHQDEVFNNANLGTCMDYTNDPLRDDGFGDNQNPNEHDYDQLVSIYTHLDSTNTVTPLLTNSGNGRSFGVHNYVRSTDFDEPSAWGKALKQDGRGKNSLYERNLGNGEKLFTFVIWAE